MRVDAVLMASGRSARFGQADKLLAPFRGRPLAWHTLHLACGIPQLGRVFFVCASPQVAALAQGFPATVIHNPHPELGQRESIRLGVEASDAEGWLFFTCDQPLLDAATVEALLQAATPSAIVAPRCQGQPGSPTLFPARYRAELTELGPGRHPRDLRRRHPNQLAYVEVADPLLLADIDTAEDLLAMEGRESSLPEHSI